jgi:DNA-binding transcriptional LysR family regulator
VNNHPVSLVGERIDVAVRITDNPEPGMIARRLGSVARCFAPRRLSGTARYPVSPEELAQHNCLHYSFLPGSPGTS